MLTVQLATHRRAVHGGQCQMCLTHPLLQQELATWADEAAKDKHASLSIRREAVATQVEST